MWAVGRQSTLPDFRLFDPLPLQTDAPTYLHTNHPPPTEPTLLFEPPIPTPPKPPAPAYDPPHEQSMLGRHVSDLCPVCLRRESNIAEHLLVDHADVVNDRMAEIRDAREPASTPEPEPDPTPITDAEPESFKDAPTERVGQPLDDYNNPRECNGCGTQMSSNYARIFSTELGDLWCPDCKSRSERYSNDGTETHGTDPASVRGSRNPNSSANKSRKQSPSAEP